MKYKLLKRLWVENSETKAAKSGLKTVNDKEKNILIPKSSVFDGSIDAYAAIKEYYDVHKNFKWSKSRFF